MTVPAPRVRRRPWTMPGRTLPLLLATVLLLPVAFLVVRAYQEIDADRGVLERERLGVEYLRALGPVTDALVEAQSAAVAGQPQSRESLDRAVEEAAAVDARIGAELRSSERWAGLRAKLEGLPDRSILDPEAVFTAYGEATDLLLALHGKVRESSGLVRDSGSDSYFLQDGVGEEMPEAMIAAGRLVDLAVLMQTRPASERTNSLGELATLRFAALQPANDLVNNLRSAVENSESTDLGASVLTPFDTYQQAVESMAVSSQPTGRVPTVDVERLSAARADAQAAANQLQPVILDELDRLLEMRIDDLDRDNRRIIGSGGFAGLLLAGLVTSIWLTRRREDPTDGGSDSTAEPTPPGTGRTVAPAAGRGPGDQLTPVLQPVGQSGDNRWRPFDAAR